jgi:site-specific DNA recombinase
MTEITVAAEQALALSYVRVSTTAQADKDVDPDGYSLPAQREANERKAHDLGAVVIAEYKDRGESAKSADRPGLQALLAHVARDRNIAYVIVHKIDRLARNREDDVAINLALRKAGAQLVSATENIDETPSGKLVHGILATIAEFYSGNLALEAQKGMSQKAKLGGTPHMAPIGYLNAAIQVDGRTVRSVIVDPDRAPLVQWAFEAYATGESSIQRIAAELERRGLRNLPRAGLPGKSIAPSRVRNLLSNRYYLGKVIWGGVEHEGRHEALISEELFEQVQTVLIVHNRSAERSRKHTHYLKGSLFCARCGSRMSYTKARGRWGGLYDYFYCLSAKVNRDCNQPHVPVAAVETAVVEYYSESQPRLPDPRQLADALLEQLKKQDARRQQDARRAETRTGQLRDERVALLQAHYAGAVPMELLKSEQARIGRELSAAEELVEAASVAFEDIHGTLATALDLASRSAELYQLADNQARRLLNQFFVSKLFVDGPEIAGSTYTDVGGALQNIVTHTTHRRPRKPGTTNPGPSGPGFEYRPIGSPNGIRTRVSTLRGWCPRPLDDGAVRPGWPFRAGNRNRRNPRDRKSEWPPRGGGHRSMWLGGRDSNPE